MQLKWLRRIDLGNGFTVFAGAAFEDADAGDT